MKLRPGWPHRSHVLFLSALALGLLPGPILTEPLVAQVISGRLVDNENRAPVMNGTVTLLDSLSRSVATVLSDREGRFTLRAPGPGHYRLRGSGLGYRGGLQPEVDLAEGQELIMDLYLVPEPLELDPIVVSAERIRNELERQGFFERREQGRGFFLTPGQLRARPPVTEVEVIGRAPFVEIQRGWTGSTIWMRDFGRQCEPQIYVDNYRIWPWAANEHVVLEDHVNAADITAVEVYRGQSEIPPELAIGFEDTCGVIMIWTVWSEMRSKKGGGVADARELREGRRDPSPRPGHPQGLSASSA